MPGPLGALQTACRIRQLLHGGVLGPMELAKLLIMDGLALREVRK
jgi:hypothetical protein